MALQPVPVPVPADDPADRQAADDLRRRAMIVCELYTAISFFHLILLCCGVGYWWSLLLLGGAAFTGVTGMFHFTSMQALEMSHCIFAPLPAVHDLRVSSICITAAGCLTCVAYVAAAVARTYPAGGTATTKNDVAVAGTAVSLAYAVTGVFGAIVASQMTGPCARLHAMRCPCVPALAHET